MSCMNTDVAEKRLSTYLTLEIFLPAIKFCIVQSIPGWVAYNNIANIILGLFFVWLFLCNINLIVKRSCQYIVLTVLTILIDFLSALISGYPNIQNFSQAFFDIVVISCTLFLTTVSIRDCNLLFDTLLKWSPSVILASIFMIVCTSTIGVVGTAETSYNMSLSYYVLVPCFVLFLGYIEKRTIKYLVLFIVEMVVIIAMGSRGPILCIGLFLLLFFFKTIRLTTKTVIALLCGILLFFIVFVNFEQIIISFYQWLRSVNIESRTLLKIIQGSIFDDSNRKNIIDSSIATIKENIFGIGFMGDLSTHNIIIENMLWFGVVFGSLLNTILLILVFRTLLLKINLQDKKRILIIVFFCYAIPDAFLNLTVWGKDMFWIYMALMLTLKKQSISIMEVRG